MIRNKTVFDLPVEPTGGIGDRISHTYITELSKAQTPEDLKKFVERWKDIFLIRCSNEDEELTKEEQMLVDGNFNPEEALECVRLNKLNADGPDLACKHIKAMQEQAKTNPEAKQTSCCGMNIALPKPLLMAFMLSQRFGVPTDAALLQMGRAFCPLSMEAHEGRRIVKP